MPEGMSMQLTFGQDGTCAMTMTMPGGQQGPGQSGTYSINGEQITISIGGDAKTGTFHFDGDKKVTLEMEEVHLVLERS